MLSTTEAGERPERLDIGASEVAPGPNAKRHHEAVETCSLLAANYCSS